PAPADMHDDVAPAAVAVSTSELPPAPEAPVSLDDVLAELGSSHPMHDGAAADIAAETIETVFDEPAPVVPHETPHEAEAFAEAPRPVRPAPELPSPAARLEEVERLLDDLGPETAAPIEEAPGVRRAEADEIPDEALDFKRQGKRRHRSTDKNPVLSSLVRLAAGLLVTSGLAVATYAGYLWIHQRMASPDQLFNQAARLVTKGEYAAASRMFEEFAALHPADPMRAEAQFNAAFAMQLQKPADSDTAQEVTSEALRLFDQYRKDNPTHAKAARAQTIMGRLNYEAGKYADAVELLRDPELRLRDPASAVPALRTLARASAKMGDAESARSYYLQAVGVQGNHSPDVDYAELGSLYQTHADKTEDLDKRIELQQLAIESWAHALEAPGIDPSNKQAIRSQLDVLRERLQNEPGMAPAMESLGDADAPVDDSAHAVAEPAAPGGDVAPAPASETPVSTPETQMTPADAGEYVVQHGDTLTSIAEAHHVTLDALVELNALKGDTVFEGQHLLLPQAAPADKESTS
ncbi:MAG: tetratricopeptide repeat protein, partial [Candidatus Hydrogenedentes bacterium]|nr:tetratricopeptide repeat protein [Candidatus Hydrogenedentota bacterium]